MTAIICYKSDPEDIIRAHQSPYRGICWLGFSAAWLPCFDGCYSFFCFKVSGIPPCGKEDGSSAFEFGPWCQEQGNLDLGPDSRCNHCRGTDRKPRNFVDFSGIPPAASMYLLLIYL